MGDTDHEGSDNDRNEYTRGGRAIAWRRLAGVNFRARRERHDNQPREGETAQ